MYSVDLLADAIAAAKLAGYEVREDWLGGSGGGACELRGRKHMFLDLSQPPRERLDQVLAALKAESKLPLERLSPALARAIIASRAA